MSVKSVFSKNLRDFRLPESFFRLCAKPAFTICQNFSSNVWLFQVLSGTVVLFPSSLPDSTEVSTGKQGEGWGEVNIFREIFLMEIIAASTFGSGEKYRAGTFI